MFHPDHTLPTGDWIFVFGSNLGGRHGKGAAKVAHKNFRAEYGVGAGPTGNAYAIPTKDRQLQVLALPEIGRAVAEFLEYARENRSKNFFVTAVGTGLAGIPEDRIAPMFAAAPPNCSLPQQWRPYVDTLRQRQRASMPPQVRPGEAA